MSSAAPAPHFRLVTLGRLALVDRAGREEPSLQKRRRKLAVLTVLAVERRPVPRDTLLELFWAEQEEARARHSLSDALSHLRRVLGPAAITIGRAEVALAPAAPLAVDAVEFADAAAAGDHARMAELWTGGFLDGVYVAGSARWEHWLDRERARLAAAAARAWGERCAALARAREWDACGALAERWLDAEPLSADAALYRLKALGAPGTSHAVRTAVDAYDRLRARLAREFALEPAPPVETLAAELRATLATWSASAASAAPVATASSETSETSGTSSAAGAAGGRDPAAARDVGGTALRGHDAPWRRHAAWLAAAALVLVTGAALARGRHAAALSPTQLAVLPFAVHGGHEHAYLREGMVDLLSTSLDGAGELHTVDPRAVLGALAPADSAVLDPRRGRELAARFGAGLYVVGEVVEAGAELRLSASLYDAARGRVVARASAAGAPGELFRTVDALTAELLARRPGAPAEQLQRTAAVTTASLPALKAYLQGEADYRVGRYASAYEAFQRAVAEDSGFALAHYRLAKTATWAALWPWDSIVAGSRRAVRHGDRLSRHTRLLVEAFDAWMHGAYDDAERRYRLVLASSPNDVEAWYELGEVLFHCNPLRGRSDAESRVPFERALALEPTHRGALVHLLRVSAEERRGAELDALVARAVAVSGDDWGVELRAFRAFALGDAAERARAAAALRAAQDAVVERTAERVAAYVDPDAAEGLVPLLTEPARPAELRGRGELWLAELAIAHGRWRAAQPRLAAARALLPRYALAQRALLAALPFLGRPREELAALRDTVARWDGSAPRHQWPPTQVFDGMYPQLRAYLLGLLDLRLGDRAGAEGGAAALDSLSRAAAALGAAGEQGRELARGMAEGLRGQLAAARGERDEALARLERARLTVSEGLLESSFGAQAQERWTRAELLREAGRLDEALRWYAGLGGVAIDFLPYRAPAALRQAEIYERLGDRRRAAERYAQAVALWRDAEPELQPLVRRARERLAALR